MPSITQTHGNFSQTRIDDTQRHISRYQSEGRITTLDASSSGNLFLSGGQPGGIRQKRSDKLAYTLMGWRRYIPEFSTLTIGAVYIGVEAIKHAENAKIRPFKQNTISDPGNPYPNPERKRFILPRNWINDRYLNKYHSRMIEITKSSEEFNTSFHPIPGIPLFFRHKDVIEDETVAYLSSPKEMSEYFSVGEGEIRIRYPNEFFVYFTDMESCYEFPTKTPLHRSGNRRSR